MNTYEEWVDLYKGPLTGYARRYVGGEQAQDAVQHAFMGLWMMVSKGVEIVHPRAILYRMVKNYCINLLKRSCSTDVELKLNMHSYSNLEDEVEVKDEIKRVFTTLSSIDERQRNAFIDFAIHGASQKEIGERLGIKENAANQLVWRARVKLREAA